MENEILDQFVRLHTHDCRNHLNGIEMELMLVEGSVSDTGGQEAIERIRNELTEMEGTLRSLTNRFADPDRQEVPAMDVFQLWEARCDGGSSTACDATWVCDLADEVITVDMRMVADTLSEWVRGIKTGSIAISAARGEGEVCFQVQAEGGEESESSENRTFPLPPGFEALIQSNGGVYRNEENNDGGWNRGVCAFPLAETA